MAKHMLHYSWARMTYLNRHSNCFHLNLNIRIRIFLSRVFSDVFEFKYLKNRVFQHIPIQMCRKPLFRIYSKQNIRNLLAFESIRILEENRECNCSVHHIRREILNAPKKSNVLSFLCHCVSARFTYKN